MADLKNFGASIGAQFQGLNGRHPSQWPIAPRVACAMAAFGAVLLVGWFAYASSEWDALEQGQQEEQKLRDEYKNKIQQTVSLDALRKQKEQVGLYVATLEKQLPSKAEMDALLSDINQAGLGRGLQFELFKPGQVSVKEYYAELPIEIKVSGGYHDIGTFASDVANLSRIVTLNNLNVGSSKDGGLTLEAVAKTFRYLDAEEVNAQRKALAEKKAGKK